MTVSIDYSVFTRFNDQKPRGEGFWAFELHLPSKDAKPVPKQIWASQCDGVTVVGEYAQAHEAGCRPVLLSVALAAMKKYASANGYASVKVLS